MEPDTKDRDSMYRLIIGQLCHDGHKQLALDLSNSIGLESLPPPSDKLFQLVFANDTNDEEKDSEMQKSLNSLVPSIDNLAINGEYRDYFPILALPKHNLDLVFCPLTLKDRLALAGVNNALNKIEKESKYYVNSLAIVEIPSIPAPLSPVTEDVFEDYDHSVVLFENKSYSSDFIRRIAHNASIGKLLVTLVGSIQFHREIYNLIKEIDVGELFLEMNYTLMTEIWFGSFILDLTRSCRVLSCQACTLTASNIHELYQIMIDGSAKIRRFSSFLFHVDSFLRLAGMIYSDGRFYSNRDIEVYKEDDNNYDYHEDGDWHIFEANLEMILFNVFDGFELIYHETRESLEKAKNREGLEKMELAPE